MLPINEAELSVLIETELRRMLVPTSKDRVCFIGIISNVNPEPPKDEFQEVPSVVEDPSEDLLKRLSSSGAILRKQSQAQECSGQTLRDPQTGMMGGFYFAGAIRTDLESAVVKTVYMGGGYLCMSGRKQLWHLRDGRWVPGEYLMIWES